MVRLNNMQPLPEFIVNGTAFAFQNEPQCHPVTRLMSFSNCVFEYQSLNINCRN